jgi:hypothetical protein
MNTRGSDEERLNALWQSYRAACPDPEPGSDFMPQLWQRIEGRRTFSFFFGRLAGGFVTAAVAATLAMAAYLYYPGPTNVYSTGTYVEALAYGSSADNADLVEVVGFDPYDPAGQL